MAVPAYIAALNSKIDKASADNAASIVDLKDAVKQVVTMVVAMSEVVAQVHAKIPQPRAKTPKTSVAAAEPAVVVKRANPTITVRFKEVTASTTQTDMRDKCRAFCLSRFDIGDIKTKHNITSADPTSDEWVKIASTIWTTHCAGDKPKQFPEIAAFCKEFKLYHEALNKAPPSEQLQSSE